MCSFLVWKNACLTYREFDPEGYLVGVPYTWYLWGQSFITLLKHAWREYDIVVVNEWKKKCVGFQWKWVSKRTVRSWEWNIRKKCCLSYNWTYFVITSNCQRFMQNIMSKQTPSNKLWCDIYIYDRYYIRTHVYMFLFTLNKRVFELSRVWPWRWTRGGTPCMVLIGPFFHYTL